MSQAVAGIRQASAIGALPRHLLPPESTLRAMKERAYSSMAVAAWRGQMDRYLESKDVHSSAKQGFRLITYARGPANHRSTIFMDCMVDQTCSPCSPHDAL